ncbi:hypothetical protein NQ318_002829, partial [Aromia moschata]
MPRNGTVNRQNCRYWADVNPHWVMEAHPVSSKIGNRVVGPYFFEGNLNGDTYLTFLHELIPALSVLYKWRYNELIPALSVLYPNEEDQDIPSANLVPTGWCASTFYPS